MIQSYDLMELITFQNVMEQLEREGRAEKLAHQVTEVVADWRLQIRLWYVLQGRYHQALFDKDWLTAKHLAEVLMTIHIARKPQH